MKKIVFVFSYIMFFFLCSSAQSQFDVYIEQDFCPAYWNREGELVENNDVLNNSVCRFNEGLTVYPKYQREKTTYGYMNKQGEMVIPRKYELAHCFSEGMAAVVENGKWGYIDKSGKYIIEPKYAMAYSFSDGLALVWDVDSMVDGTNLVMYFIDKKGNRQTKKYRGVHAMTHFSSGIVRYGGPLDVNDNKVERSTKGVSYVKRNGQIMFNGRNFDEKSSDFSEGYALILSGDSCYVVDTNERVLGVFMGVEDLYSFHEGYAPIRIKGRIGFVKIVQNKAVLAIAPKYEGVGFLAYPKNCFNEGLCWVEEQSNWGVIDTNGTWVIRPHYSIPGMPFSEGVSCVLLSDGSHQYIDRNDKVIWNSQDGFIGEKRVMVEVGWLRYNPVSYESVSPIELGIKSKYEIQSVKMIVNGVTDRAMVVKADGYDFRHKYQVDLREGENTIRVEVQTAAGVTVSEKTVTYTPPKKDNQGKRIALVMGNAAYSAGNQLKNPVNDATAIANKLESLGFTVMRANNQGKQQMENTISEFGKKAKEYDVALFFYAGHGQSSRSANYMIPIGANLPDEEAMRYNCVDIAMVMDVMEKSGCDMNIIIIDACRDNQFSRSWRSGGVEGFVSTSAPDGTFIAFSTALGKRASDGGVHSPYATALLKVLDKPNLELESFFKEVAKEVYDSTKGTQRPWISSSVLGKFVFNSK